MAKLLLFIISQYSMNVAHKLLILCMSFTVVIWKCSHNFGLDIVSQNPSIMKSGSFFITLAKLFKNSCTKICDRGVGQVLRRREIQGGHGTGKTGNLVLTFSRQGKHREFCFDTGKNSETQGKYFSVTQGKYLTVIIKIKSMSIF